MKNIIKQKLLDIQTSYNIKILYACESGSRAWGFASKDSDYDVRFIYVKPLEYYLSLGKKCDVLECELNDTFDINGWDLSKFLYLLAHSNMSAYEWLQSDIIYQKTQIWKEIQDEFLQFFNVSTAIYSYLVIAKTQMSRHIQNKKLIKYKKYLYVIRPLIACEYILKYQKPALMNFNNLLESVEISSEVGREIKNLLKFKLESSEKDFKQKSDVLNTFCIEKIDKFNNFLARKKHKSNHISQK
ncbi:nucleotidyltransferase domain-containing protein [Campylobacter geochelonis]|uniref:nucleotidyltransferase domain-containing protein n=2 Tax=Campylobacter geochelonis TaxID=1780362 RepID=UPI0007709B73|nr:nucleotidyltransferase domain-containing protein [Campylobacter geochelonis]CZE46211.1 Predicted nucleotidyltransferase [Campylobacter geochelonis]